MYGVEVTAAHNFSYLDSWFWSGFGGKLSMALSESDFEFEDSNYVSNPVNRCYFCKTNLYDTMMRHVGTTLVSGTNLDDLGDYRPGLIAAEHGNRSEA